MSDARDVPLPGATVSRAAVAGRPERGRPERERPTRTRPAWARAVDRVSDVCGVVSATMILVAVVLTCQMIWVRYVSNSSTVWQTESVIYLVLGATLIGLPYVQRVRGHVSVDLLPSLLPDGARRALAAFVLVVAIVVSGVMFVHAFELWHVAFTRGWKTDTVWGPPQWIPYAALPIGFGLFAVQLAADLGAIASGVVEDVPGSPAEAIAAEAGEVVGPGTATEAASRIDAAEDR